MEDYKYKEWRRLTIQRSVSSKNRPQPKTDFCSLPVIVKRAQKATQNCRESYNDFSLVRTLDWEIRTNLQLSRADCLAGLGKQRYFMTSSRKIEVDYQQNGTTELSYVRAKNSGMVWGRKIHTFCINSSRLIKRENKLEMCMLHKVWECDLVCCICTAWNFNTIQSSKFHWKSFKPRCYLLHSLFYVLHALVMNIQQWFLGCHFL